MTNLYLFVIQMPGNSLLFKPSDLNDGILICYSSHDDNNGSFKDRIGLDHSNTKLVRFSDCNLYFSSSHQPSQRFHPNLHPDATNIDTVDGFDKNASGPIVIYVIVGRGWGECQFNRNCVVHSLPGKYFIRSKFSKGCT